MKKIVIHKAGSYERLQIEEFADLTPKDDEVVVQVRHIGVNYADCLVRWGVYASAKEYVGWPITPGFEFTGVVLKVGSAVRDRHVGQEVMGVTLFNAYATQACVRSSQLFSLPKGFSLSQAAGFPAVFFTAFHALFQIAKIYPGSNVLIHSAAGGVGSALTQLASVAGFQVTAVVGASHKVEYAKRQGALHVIDKSKEDLWAKARELVPEGFDAVFDANGYSTYQNSYDHLRPTGKLIAYGSHSLLPKGGSGRMNYLKAAWGLLKTPRFSPLDLISDNKSVVGFNLSFLFARADLLQESIQQLQEWCTQGKIQPPQVTEFSFEEVAEAHRFLESGQSIGKTILTV
ncbi:MAG: synaptic vesicle VAT-1 family membrane protein [Bdellovibrio sp.]